MSMFPFSGACRRLARWLGLAAAALGLAAPALASAGPGAGPAAAERLRIDAVEVVGNRLVGDAEIQALAAGLLGREVGTSELEQLRHDLTRLYLRRGYVNSGVLYRDPAIRDGVLRLRVVEGRITRASVRGAGRLAPEYVLDRLRHGDEVLDLAVLQQRYQLLLDDPLFERIDVAVQPAEVPGEAALEIDLVRARPWSLVAFADNYRNASTGEIERGVRGVLRNLTGYGDAFDARLQFADHGGRASFGWSSPLGARGTRASLHYEDGEARVVEAPLDDADVESSVRSSEIGLEQALVEQLDRRLAFALAYAERRSATTVLGEPFSFTAGEPDGVSRVRVVRFSQEYGQRARESVLALRSVFNFGRGNTLPGGPGDASDLPARHFSYWVGQGQYLWRPAGRPWRLLARVAAQKAQDRLLPIERFGLGGHASVRGYRENTLVRDNGYLAGLELHLRAAPLPGWLDLFVFHDHGVGWNRDGARERLRSLGLGLSCEHRGLRLDLAWAHNVDMRPPSEERRLQDRGLHLAMSYAF